MDLKNLPIVMNLFTDIGKIEASRWDFCAGQDNPFVSHGFLSALESSGSVTAERGWQPCHLFLETEDGRPLAATPLYLKSHSYGEYVFDWGWARAMEQAGRPYYPKLQCAVPFTPATGPRLLVPEIYQEQNRKTLQQTLLNGMLQIMQEQKASSLHITFPTVQEWKDLAQPGIMQRTGLQYHWQNRDYSDFGDFLNDLSSRKRKAIRKERKAAQASCSDIRWLRGSEITPEIWARFYSFYLSTVDKKFAYAYLTPDFFEKLGQLMGDRVLLSTAWQQDELVAAALNLEGQTTLYGRYWGCKTELSHLHFELCYYQAIDHAIEKGLSTVEAGAQGDHKLQRGYLPTETYSLHAIADPGLRRAVEFSLRDENRAIKAEIDALLELSPFKRDIP